MNSKITITFNQIPDEGTVLYLLDSAYGSTSINAIFATSPSQPYEVARSTSAFNAATYYYFHLRNQFPNASYTYSITNGIAVVTIESSNPASVFSVVSNTTSGKVTTLIDNSTGTPSSLPTGSRTLIDAAEQITFCNSPIHLRLQNAAKDATIQSVYVYLWIWNGDQDKSLGAPNRVLFKKKVSASDTYINFEIADFIKAFLETPDNAPNTNQPNFGYNDFSPAAITGQGVFWQIITDITSTAGTVRNNYETNFATLGYRWNYEQNSLGNNGLTPNGSTGFLETVKKWYNPKISQYFTQSFKLDNAVADATSANMITRASVTPPTAWTRCSQDGALIVYLNKLGLWELFTPHGKIVASSRVDADEQNRGFRDPSQIDNTYVHSKTRGNIDVSQSWLVNTGSLTEDMINDVEQIIYSPKVYLIKFNGEVQEATTVGITIDSTLITIDDTNITIDSETITEEYIGTYKQFEQIPVIVKDSDFTRKNRLNDRNKIDYNIKFEETNNKILDIR